jgi:hypothetical protein
MLGTTMWATAQQPVDNQGLYMVDRTTQMQDVLAPSQGCEFNSYMSFGVQGVHPQSTPLITVIKSLYKHPQITMNNVGQGAW